MTSPAEKLIGFAREAWRSRWLGAIAAAVICAIGWPIVLLIPNVYEAHASVYVNTSSALQPLLKGLAIESDLISQVELVRQVLLSREELQQVAERNGLYASGLTQDQRDLLITDLRSRIVITGGRNARDSLYTITYRNRDRDKALAVVRSLVDTFVESTRGQKLVATDSAERFLLARKEDYEHRLTEAENKLAEFRRTNMGLLPGEHRDYFARLQEQLDLRSVAQRGLEQAQSERRQIQEQLAGEKPVTAVPGANPSDVAPGQPGYTRSSIDRRIQEAEDQLSQMRTRWTDKHPAIVAQREQIEELRAEKQRYLKALGVAGLTDSPVSIESNPVYQSLRMALSQVELKIFQLTAEISTRNTTIAELERFADTLPRVEADYQQLNRDYNVINAQYQEVVRRLETARLSGEADQSEDVDFRTIEPATADSQPVAPKRLLLLPGVFFGALAIGIWAAVMRSHLTPVLYTVQDVTRVSGLPVLGLVSRASTDGRRVSIRGRVFRFAGASVVFGFVFLLVLVLGIADSAWLSALRAHLS